jgi:hypothetical protein
MNMIAAPNEISPNALLIPCILLPADTVTGGVVPTGGFVEAGVLPVGLGTVVFPDGVETAVVVTGPAEHSDDVGMSLALDPSTTAKLAQLMRVLFEKWTTKLRLPKKAPIPSAVEANWS